ncbi:hypothetical protein AAE478_006172 [Parahypoxylon ruwenzoriense]
MSCSYPPDATPRPPDRDQPSNTVHNRIRELENLVHALMQRAASRNPPPNAISTPHANSVQAENSVSRAVDGSPDNGVPSASGSVEPSECGTLTNSPAGVSYVDSAHWTALLDGISELKDCIPDTSEPGYHYYIPSLVEPDYGPSPQLLYGRFAQASKGEILSTVPKRPVVDRLMSRFFNTIDLAPALIHSGQFVRQYEQFWADPYATPTMWVGLLFSIMCLSTLVSMPHAGHDPIIDPPSMESAVIVKVYREKTVQCLTLGKYTRGGPYVLETLILYIAGEHLLHEDAESGTHILLGMILHVAMRMGYHRDPKNFPVVSAFDGEMRRRLWAAIYQANLMFSSQMGLPSMLKDHQIDTEEPRNLIDSEFDEDVAALPPSRPETEVTPVLYVIVRTRVAYLWERVRDIATDTKLHKYDEIMGMDAKVQAEQRRLPPSLRMQPIEKSIADSPQIIMQRIWLDICFLRLQIVLHKKYFMAPSSHYQRYGYSRSVSLKSAMKIIEYQHMVYEKVQPNGLLYDVRWKLSSVMNSEFLLATSMLCAYMKQVCCTPESAVEGISTQEVSQLLMKSMENWQRICTTSRHARRAVEAIRLVLRITGTPVASPAGVENELSQMFAFQDPLFLDFNIPCIFDGVYNVGSSTSASEPELDSTPFTQQPTCDDEWVRLFQRVSSRVPD